MRPWATSRAVINVPTDVQSNGQGFDNEEVTCVSTLTVDDELYQWAAEAAAAQGKTVDEFVGEALRKALSMVGVRRTVHNGLPVMVVSDDTPP
jgi:hypothetical protein